MKTPERYIDPNRDYKPFEKHTAESVWQKCCCQSCQDMRFFIDAQPGTPIDYATYRHRDERY